MHYRVKSFLADTIELCREQGITLKLVGKPYVKICGSRCTGLFDESNKILAVAMDNPPDIWISILVHELSHLDQAREKNKIWADADKYVVNLDEWLRGKVKKLLPGAVDRVQLMELDCEKRAVKKIEDYSLPLSIEEYIQKANSYLMAYRVAKQQRKWFPQPYKIPGIWNNMPTTFMSNKNYMDDKHKLLKLYKK